MNAEQQRYLAAGNRHRARFNGAELAPADLTLVLAWWCQWWRERADHAEVRNADPATGDMFDEPSAVG